MEVVLFVFLAIMVPTVVIFVLKTVRFAQKIRAINALRHFLWEMEALARLWTYFAVVGADIGLAINALKGRSSMEKDVFLMRLFIVATFNNTTLLLIIQAISLELSYIVRISIFTLLHRLVRHLLTS